MSSSLWYSLSRLSVNQEEVSEGMALGQAFLTGDDLNGSREMKRRRKNRDHQTAAPEYRAVGLLIMDRKNKYGLVCTFRFTLDLHK